MADSKPLKHKQPKPGLKWIGLEIPDGVDVTDIPIQHAENISRA